MKLTIARDLVVPVDAVTETFGIVGIRGSGKSTTAKVLVEELTKAGQQCVVIDPLGSWWGLKASADGKTAGLPFTILGGRRADVPITADAGHVIADLVIDATAPLIIDLSEMRKAGQRTFMTAFVEQLYHRSGGSKAVHVVVDECDLFVPQRPMKGEERLLGAMEDLVRRGRFKGLGVSLISQRPASIHKDVLSQVSVLVAHRLVGPQDRAALDSWVQAHGTPERRAQMLATLASQKAGQAWFWSPSWLDIFQQTQVRAPETFDSSATPKAGVARIEPKVLAPVDIEALRERMAAVVAKAEENDPKALRRQIAELRRQLADRPAGDPVTVEVEVERIVEVEVIPEAVCESIDRLVLELEAVGRAVAKLEALRDQPRAPVTPPTAATQASRPSPTPAPVRPPRPQRTRPSPAPADSGGPIKAGARRMVDVVARYAPRRLTRAQLSTLAHVANGGTFSNYVRSILATGYVVEGPDGIELTDAGAVLIGATEGPFTTGEIVDMYAGDLKAGARRMLDLLVEHHPDGHTRSELSELSDIANGGTFSNYVRSLLSRGLASESGGQVRANDTLFLGAR